MNLLEIHNKILQHLLQQGEPASPDEKTCKYRLTKNGKTLMCAVGCLVKDEAYDPGMEGNGVYAAAVTLALQKSGIPLDSETLGLLGAWQQAHDAYRNSSVRNQVQYGAPLDDWSAYINFCATRIANKYSLTPKETT